MDALVYSHVQLERVVALHVLFTLLLHKLLQLIVRRLCFALLLTPYEAVENKSLRRARGPAHQVVDLVVSDVVEVQALVRLDYATLGDKDSVFWREDVLREHQAVVVADPLMLRALERDQGHGSSPCDDCHVIVEEAEADVARLEGVRDLAL